MHQPAPAARRTCPGSSRAGQPERRLEHQPLDEREPLGVELLDRRHVLHAGVVDQDVGLHVVPRPSASIDVTVGEVGDQVVAADVVGDLLGAGLVAVEHDHVRAVRGQPRGDGRGRCRWPRRSPGRCGRTARVRDGGLTHGHDARGRDPAHHVCGRTHSAVVDVRSAHAGLRGQRQRAAGSSRSASWTSSPRAGSRQSSPSRVATRSSRWATVFGWTCSRLAVSRGPGAGREPRLQGADELGAAPRVVGQHRADLALDERVELGRGRSRPSSSRASPEPGGVAHLAGRGPG